MSLLYNVNSATGTFNGVTSGSQVNGNAVFIGSNFQKVATLNALATVLADTNTFTIASKWQVSNDNSTWVDLANGPQNASAVVIATGTSGADTAVTKAIPAPESIYGWRWARLSFVAGGTTGASIDTYTVGYCYRQRTGAEAR